jgi:hypothetical protein
MVCKHIVFTHCFYKIVHKHDKITRKHILFTCNNYVLMCKHDKIVHKHVVMVCKQVLFIVRFLVITELSTNMN